MPLPLLRCFLGRRGVGDFWGQRASPDPVPVFEESSNSGTAAEGGTSRGSVPRGQPLREQLRLQVPQMSQRPYVGLRRLERRHRGYVAPCG